MFWRKKNQPNAGAAGGEAVTYEEAREATRRAVFLNLAGKMTSDQAYKENLAELFRVCRSQALLAGAASGLSETEIDKEISSLCDSDTARLKEASDTEFREFREFAAESRQIVNDFLGKLNIK